MDLRVERERIVKEVGYIRDYWKFSRDIMGYTDMNGEHGELCKFLMGGGKWKVVLMPRYTFKSCLCTIGYSLWRMLREPNVRILIYSDAAGKAEGFLGGIKSHIEGKVSGSRWREEFGEWEQDARVGKWNESQIVVSKRYSAYAEPTVDTGGIETSKIGFHYDMIIFDDIVSDKNVTTKEQMDKVSECYRKSLSLLKPGGEVLIVGTRWHFGDLYGRLIEENKKNCLFDIFIRKAVEDDGRHLFDDIGENSLTKERLALLRSQQGSYVFSCLYQNSPVDDETAVFKARDFAFSNVLGEDLYVTGTIDPAGEGEDCTAITVCGTDNEMNIYILEAVNEVKMPLSKMVERIIALNYRYKFRSFGVETNFFRGMLKQELTRRIMEEHQENPKSFRMFGIHEFKASTKSGEGKFNRICALQPYHERGALKFPGEKLELLQGVYSALAHQMLRFPRAPHDDILDSLAYHLPLIRKGGVAKKKEVPYRSPAWLEKQMYNDEIKRRQVMPRRLRERVYVAPLSLS